LRSVSEIGFAATRSGWPPAFHAVCCRAARLVTFNTAVPVVLVVIE
jgi:hypothetical protein